MSKYIDADRLQANIKEIENEFKTGNYYLDNSEQAVGYYNALMDFKQLVLSLQQEQDLIIINKKDWEAQEQFRKNKDFGKPFQQEQPKVDLEKFTDKIKTFQGRYKHPEIVSIKGAMAFMARMFYQYPNVARQWYDNLPKVTMD